MAGNIYPVTLAIAERNALSFMPQPFRPASAARSLPSVHYSTMATQTIRHCKTLGFDKIRIQETLSILGLNAAYGLLAGQIREEIIAGRADELVNSCFSVLVRSRGFSLIERYIGSEG